MAFRNFVIWLVLVAVLLILFVVDISLGSVKIPLFEVVKILLGQKADAVWRDIIWNFRMTKALTCVLAGGSLSLAGLQMQTLFRNPLAGPDVLGLTSGASLVVSLVFMGQAAGIALVSIQTPWAIAVAAAVGCAGVFMIMIAISRRLTDNVSLLIVGLMIGATTSSIVSVLQYLSKAEEMQIYLFWTFGNLGNLDWTEITILATILLIGYFVAAGNVKSLNAWLLGDRYAMMLGVNLKKSRYLMMLSASILTGGVTAFCGPLAFVGLAVPHLVKIVINTSQHQVLIPFVVLGGAILLLFCDIVSQLPGDFLLPINAITALVGAPVVIWIILRIKKIGI